MTFTQCTRCKDSPKKGFLIQYKVVVFKTGTQKVPTGTRPCSLCKGKGLVPYEDTEATEAETG